MLSNECLNEFRNVAPEHDGPRLDRLIGPSRKGQPLLIHGSFARAVPQAASLRKSPGTIPSPPSNHGSRHLLAHKVAGLNPATSLRHSRMG